MWPTDVGPKLGESGPVIDMLQCTISTLETDPDTDQKIPTIFFISPTPCSLSFVVGNTSYPDRARICSYQRFPTHSFLDIKSFAIGCSGTIIQLTRGFDLLYGVPILQYFAQLYKTS